MLETYQRIRTMSATERLIEVQRLKREGKTKLQVMQELGCSRTTIYRLWNEIKTISLQDVKHIEAVKRKEEIKRLKLEKKEIRRLGKIDRMRGHMRKYQTGVSPEEYNKMFSHQDGRCKICGTPQSELKKALALDHCHTTGKIRGLLCVRCNLGIGMFADNIIILKNAVEYLQTQETCL